MTTTNETTSMLRRSHVPIKRDKTRAHRHHCGPHVAPRFVRLVLDFFVHDRQQFPGMLEQLVNVVCRRAFAMGL
jgi:hypothetical protein